MKRVGLYVRVSTQEQKKHGLSVDNQIVALREFCAHNGYEEIALYNDAGISARKSYKKRPALLQMLKDCQQGKIDLLLFTKLDRFFRSVPDYYACVEQMSNVPWRAIWEDYETETSAGVFKVNIMLSIAQAEADRTSERIKSTLDYKRAKGDYVGSVPFGYVRKDGKLYKDEATKELVRKMFDTYLETHSSKAVRQMMSDNGCPISLHKAHLILFGEVYKGSKDESFYEPYITEEEYTQIQDIKLSNYRATKAHHTYLFQGIVRCGKCGSNLRSAVCYNGGHTYYSYLCRSNVRDVTVKHRCNMSEPKIEKYVLDNLEELISKYNMTISASATLKEKEGNQNKIKSLEAKLSRIGFRFEEGDISKEEYKEKRKAILAELTSLKSKEYSDIIELPSEWKEIYSQLDKEHQRRFWYSIIKHIDINQDKTIDVYFL